MDEQFKTLIVLSHYLETARFRQFWDEAAKNRNILDVVPELHVIDESPQLIFVRSNYTIETVEAERISVDHVAHLKPFDGASAATQFDPEDIPSKKVQAKSSRIVLSSVGVACLGVILFGYHLGLVNGELEYLAKDLGIAENAVLQESIQVFQRWRK